MLKYVEQLQQLSREYNVILRYINQEEAFRNVSGMEESYFDAANADKKIREYEEELKNIKVQVRQVVEDAKANQESLTQDDYDQIKELATSVLYEKVNELGFY